MECKKKELSDLKATKQYKYKACTWCPKHGMWTVHKPEECKLPESKGEKYQGGQRWQKKEMQCRQMTTVHSNEYCTSGW